ncbi:MAG: LLM class flavin-dependent oxidoreductase, partial [Chromatiales bacterium]
MNVASCFVIGGRSFLIRCVEQLLDLGFDVRGIFSNDADVVRWADQHSIACMPAQGQALEQLAGERFDYLFSIVNLSVLPESVVQAPAKAAINFHDGPLPRYAGLNTPAWAIINGEAGHGITWHYMTGDVDEGDILTQRQLTIDADETSLSLNGKCYEAGLDAFSELLGRLQKGGLEATPQDLSQRNYFAYCQRPEAAGLLDLRQPAERLSALMRALDFGNYENPLGLPKLWLGERAVVISGHKIEFGASSEAPGTLLKVNEAGLLVSTASRDLLLTGLRDFGGEVLCPLQTLRAAGLQAGDRLSLPDTTLIERIEAADAAACRTENRWRGALTRLEPVAVPYAKRIAAAGQTRARNSRAMELPQGVNGRRALAAFAHYLSRLNGQGSFDLLYGDCAKLSASRECAGQVVPLVPWRIDIAGAESADTLYCALENELAQLAGRSAHASDLGLRLGDAGGKTGADGISAVPVAIIAGEVEAIEDLERVPLLLVAPQSGGTLQWHYDSDVYDDATLAHMQNQYAALLTAVLEDGQRTPERYSVLSTAERERLLTEWNATAVDYPIGQTIHGLFEAQAARTPDATALVFQNDALSYRELNERSNLLAHDLLARGVTRDSLVGVALERSTEMVVALLAILKAGGAYVPMDPHYPHDRLLYMAEDAGLSLILCERGHFRLFDGLSAELLDPRETATGALSQNPASTADPASLAYVIYTSGSTGNPKGVMVEHRNIINFFTGMDARIGADTPGTWLAVTSISFDISVLELFWTLCRGYKMVLYAGDEEHQPERPVVSRYPDRHIDFSLFFWNYSSNEDIQEHSKYHLLMEAAKFGDRHGFVAAWTPERHFHSFGGLFPNPSVISAALAAVTENIHLRSGSVVLPLHSPIRVAEEWAVVDNLSDGRVGIGVAAGWQPNDFAIRPENHANAKQVMMESLEQVRRLWRGETLTFPGPKGDVELTTLPRPVQPELPVWLTAAGNPETFRMAGEAGCGILTHLLGQSVEDVNSSIAIYREAWRDAGHPGEGHVVLMLHTFIGEDEDEVKAIARGPMKSYLTNAATLVKAAAWHFPTFKDLSERGVKTIDEFVDNISAEDFDDLLEFAFERYYSTSGLFGTPERALRLVDQLKKIGVDEIGCLVDYGIEADQVLAHLPWLEQVRQAANPQREAPENDFSIPALLRRHQASHFQCTPSMATMLLADPSSRDALAGLDCMMVGGEALPPALAGELHELVSGKVVNMYGPTETTIWSSTHSLEADLQLVPIGRPIANTSIYLLDGNRQPVPIGVPGELYIGGAGVVRGYLKRPELTAERFLDDPFVPGARIYRTGDLARYREDGVLDFLGRVDHQVKIRGHRIELGEIEARLGQHPDVLECVVVDRADCSGARMLVAYLTPLAGARPAAQVLRLFLGEKLPEFMLPSHFVAIDTLPKTPNGKIDRNALPEPGAVRASAGDYIAPRDALEEAVTDIWREVLLVQQIGMQDNFFDLGGHSLTAAQLIARLRATFGVELPLRTLFEASTVEQVAARLRQQQTEAGSVDEIAELVREIYALSPKTLALELSRQRRDDAEADPQVTEATSDDARAAQCEELLERRRRNRPHAAGESIPALGLAEPRLSFSQRRMWFIDQLEPGAHYNDNFALILDGALDSTALERAVNAIVGRHQVLRTHFATHEGEPYQAIVGDLPIELVQVDLDK